MSRVAALGAWSQLAGYGLVGVEVVDAPDPESVREAWAALPADVGLVLLTPEARLALPDALAPGERFWTVVPE